MWRRQAEQLWGEDWQLPLAQVAGVNGRTAQRWAASGTCPDRVAEWLAAAVVRVPERLHRAYGAALLGAIRRSTSNADAAEAARLAAADLFEARLP